MQIGMIGLGKMGANMSRRLLRNDHDVVGYDLSEDAMMALEEDGGETRTSLEALVDHLEAPRTLWMMVPAGDAVDSTLDALLPLLNEGDRLVDGGNSRYTDTLKRAGRAEQVGVSYIDVGTSGGVWGLEQGYSLMVGGPDEAIDALTPLFETLAPSADKGWGHVGEVGAGHFVKMVHNGIEYGVMQAYAEGFHILKAKEEFDFDLHQISEIWRFGSVIRSWLLDLAAEALEKNQDLEEIAAWVDDSGEGRWTVQEAIDLDVPAPVITDALIQRLQSRQQDTYAHRLLAALRNEFGGHAMKEAE
ncbi:6-phosphogluconate dehydrogenase (decarboxylating) [Longibacter salinarum]|uniref:6-phosphogluconate dehydrogenase (Decarboxylating) n=1 Tax=Longibacter salinarum TaxID=1850348 RepID=A0A2A8CYN3_9BACT|nr:decarboxylating 6-phosphogluconate dehydrogenase [Longibacter salinarum]PEN13714.1 6-phosphogluconate dehydrogenase (decarboxylating) [Longibacter salinarum]